MTTKISKNLINDNYVLTVGDTMTGELQVLMPSPSVQLKLDGTAGTIENNANLVICYDETGTQRALIWHGIDSTASPSDNDVMNLVVRDRAAGSIVTRMSLTEGNVAVTSAPAPINDDHLTRKDYVDNNYLALADDYIAGHNAEGRFMQSASLTNDFANARHRGSTFIFTAVTPANSSIDAMFSGNSDFYYIDVPTQDAGGGWPIVIEFTVPRILKWGTTVGIGFGTSGFRCNAVKIEAFSEGAWVTCIDTITNTSEDIYVDVPGNVGVGTTSVRYTLSDPASTASVRINHLWATNYQCENAKWLHLPRVGGELFGDLSVPKVLITSDFSGVQQVNGALDMDCLATTTNIVFRYGRHTNNPGLGATTQWSQCDGTTGSLMRYDHKTGDLILLTATPAGDTSVVRKDYVDDSVIGYTAQAGNATNTDLDGTPTQTNTLTANVSLTTSNRVAGRHVDVFYTASVADRTVTLNASWISFGEVSPIVIPVGKKLCVTLVALGTAETDIQAVCVLEN